MTSQNENEDPPEESVHSPNTMQPEQEHFEAIQVLETMRNLIVEIQSFKAENEQLKRAQEKQQEINKILIQILHGKNNGKEKQTKSKKSQENGQDAEGDGISSNDTQGSENQVKPVGKRNIDHLEGDFKNINQHRSIIQLIVPRQHNKIASKCNS